MSDNDKQIAQLLKQHEALAQSESRYLHLLKAAQDCVQYIRSPTTDLGRVRQLLKRAEDEYGRKLGEIEEKMEDIEEQLKMLGRHKIGSISDGTSDMYPLMEVSFMTCLPRRICN